MKSLYGRNTKSVIASSVVKVQLSHVMTSTLLLVIALIFTACTRTQNPNNFDNSLHAAIADGFIMSIDNATATAGRELNLIEVTVTEGSAQRPVSTVAQFLIREDLSFRHADRYINNVYVELGQLVSAGDVLATTIFEPPDILLAQQRLLRQEVARFEADSSIEYSRLRSEIEELRMALTFATDNEWERHSLRLSLYELRLENFLLNRRHERENFRTRQADMYDMLAAEQIIAPFCGVITFVANVTHGATLLEGQRIISIADTSSLYFITVLAPDTVIRYGDVFPLEVTNVVEFYVRVISDNFAAGLQGPHTRHYLAPVNPSDIDALLYAIDYDWLELERLRMRAYPTWNMFGEGILMSDRNIHYDGYRPFVLVYENGSIGRRFVTLAPYNLPMRYVYIISGLEPGQWVVGHD